MRDFLLNILTIAICLHGLAWHSTERHDGPVAYDLLAVFSADHADALPEKYKYAPITDIVVTEKTLQFRLEGLVYRVRWIGERSRMLMFNGRVFSAHELENFERFKRAFRAKFSISKKTALSPLNQLFFTPAYARRGDSTFFDTEAMQREEEERNKQDEQENNTGVEVVGGSGSFLEFPLGVAKKLYSPDATMADTRVGRDLEAKHEVMTGANQMGHIKFVYDWLGGLAYAMNPAGGFKPGLEFVNELAKSPRSIPFPFS